MFSVIIGLVSTEDRGRIFETLDALRAQDTTLPYEVVVVDRMNDEVSAGIGIRHPEVRLISCARSATLPQMRALGFAKSHGSLVAVTEDHCVPPANWIAQLHAAFMAHPDVAAVGGSVTNGVTTNSFHWATFLCEYAAFLPPVPEGPCDVLPGMNVAYRRESLEALPADVLRQGFWETSVHPRFVHGQLYSTNDVSLDHRKAFSMRWFLVQRFAYSRHYAGTRFAAHSILIRVLAAIACVALPLLLLLRIAPLLRAKRLPTPVALAALPILFVFYVAWALGECVGCLRGPVGALEIIE